MGGSLQPAPQHQWAYNPHHNTSGRITRTGAFRGIRLFFIFLREERAAGRTIAEPDDLRSELLQAYAAWLQRRGLGLPTQALYFGYTVCILRELRRSRGARFGHLVVPHGQFPGGSRQRASDPMRKLDAQALQALRVAAWT